MLLSCVRVTQGSVTVVGSSMDNSSLAVQVTVGSSDTQSLWSDVVAVDSDRNFAFVVPPHVTWAKADSTIQLRVRVSSRTSSLVACLCGSLAQCALSLKRLSAGPGFNPQTRQNKLFHDYWRAYFEINFSDRQEGLTVSSIICDR